MTFTTRDKILLGVLAVILFVGMMYLYGVMPANEEAEKLETQINTKQQELNDLLAKIAAININSLDAEYDKLLDYYYTTKEELASTATLPDKIGIIAIERMVVAMLDSAGAGLVDEGIITQEQVGLSEYSTRGWKINEERLTAEYEGYQVGYYIAHADCSTSFRAHPEVVHDFIDEIKNNDFFTLTDISIVYSQEDITQEDPETGETTVVGSTPVAEGSITLVYYMAVKTGEANAPQLLPEVGGLSADGATVTFNTVENAVKYEFYTVAADGTVNLIKNFTVNDNGENTMTVKFSSAQLASGAHTVAVRAVGNKTQGYFKSPLPDADTTTVMVTI